ncbi:DNA cytosine methyltransferase [Streptomyces sp. NPDC058855]|uniref:DNA cytosine methyltransferase n=1 Tax=Streptomyces sp. NPDC058855 TaxID=3346651 RepID=UPI0036A5D60E
MSHTENPLPRPAEFRILDLFAGPGGLDVAAHVLGHQVTGIEWDDGACATRTRAGMDTFQGDVRRYRAAFFPRAQVLTGGPPCQTFTVAGHGAGRKALNQVTEYIERLHAAVRDTDREEGEEKLRAWKRIFRTWRRIHEELRVKEEEAEAVRREKRHVEKQRAGVRKDIRDRLERLGMSKGEITRFMKRLMSRRGLDVSPDIALSEPLKTLDDLNARLEKFKARLEELGDERTGLVLQPLWWVIERSRRPGSEPYEAVVLEQVPAVLPVWNEYAKVLVTLGYGTATQLMHTEAFGVPQTRRRAVLMARLGEPDPLPKVPETHLPYQRGTGRTEQAETLPLETAQTLEEKGAESTERAAKPKEPWVSMARALEAAQQVEGSGVRPRPPFTVISNYGTGGDPEARGRRDHDTPSATITGKVSRNRVVHQGTDEDLDDGLGRFNPAEAGVLQTFPSRYPWCGNDLSQQIGNAVPPRLALHVLRHVLEPQLAGTEADKRLEQAVVDLEHWKPARSVKPLGHRDLKGHPLSGG